MLRPRSLVGPLLEWFADHARDLPWRRTRDPYAIWISEVMLQQTQVKTVVPYWEHWMRALPRIADLAVARPAQVLKLWEGLGYYRRARSLHAAARIIMTRHAGRFPHEFAQVLALPGVGRYTAGAICSIAFDQPTPALDGNVMRVLARVCGIRQDPRRPDINRILWRLAETLVKEAARPGVTARSSASAKATRLDGMGGCSQWNQALMELGAVICTRHQPSCSTCPWGGACVARRAGTTNLIPAVSARSATSRRRVFAYVVRQAGKVLVRRRAPASVNAGLWEFPTLEVTAESESPSMAARRLWKKKLPSIRPLARIKHSITRFRYTLDVFEATVRPHERRPETRGVWRTWAQLKQLPFTAAHRRIVRLIESRECGHEGKVPGVEHLDTTLGRDGTPRQTVSKRSIPRGSNPALGQTPRGQGGRVRQR